MCGVEDDHLEEEEEEHDDDQNQAEDQDIDMQSHLDALQVVCTAATNSASSEGEDGCSSSFNFHMENKHTQRKTDTDMRTLSSYLKSLNESRNPERIPPDELDNYLSSFFMVVRKADGSEYEPKTLRAIMASIERYLRCRNYPASITRDYIFSKTRDSLKEKQRILKEQGIGNKPRPPADPLGVLVAQRVNQLYAKQNMGPYNPLSVVSTLIFVFIVHFRLRKAVDHKNLLWGDIQLKVDKNGREYLVYRPQSLPSLPPHIENHIRRTYNIYAQPDQPERDPVAIYHLYAEKRPASMKYSNSPFYLGIFSLNPLPFQDWYRASAMGINKLCDLVKQIRSITGLPRAMYAQDSPYLSPQFISNALMGPDPSKGDVKGAAAAAAAALANSQDLSCMDTVVYNVDSDSESITEQQSNMSFIGSLENHSSMDENIHGEEVALHEKDAADDDEDDDDDDDENDQHPLSDSLNAHRMYADIAKTDYSECGPANATLSLPNNSPLQLTYDSPRYMDSREQDDVFLTLEHAKEQFLSLLQKMDIDALVAFDKWLKMMRISRNPLTGKVICRENAVVHSSVNPQTAGAGNEDNLLPEDHKDHTVPTISGVYGSFPNTNITVNITLSPQALMGQGPITVTANTASSSHEGGGGSGTHRSSGGNNAAVSGSNSLPNGIRCATSSSATTTTIDLSQAGPSTSRSSTIAEDRIHALAIGSFSHSKSHSARTSQPGVKVVATNCSSSSSNSTNYEHPNQPAFPIHLVPNNASYDGSGSSKKSRLDMTAVLSGPTNLSNSGQVEHNQSTERSRFKRILPKPSSNYLRNPSSASHHGLAASSTTSSSSSSSSFRHSTGSNQNRLASAPSSLSTSALTATSSTQNRYVSMPSKDGHSSSENSVIFIKQDPD
ncbi:Hypothetical predicted protein [Octopus vulgaris]|uniref:ZMYM2-like/QRICH1 C-terminal domain-containing protein n=1 Tax=Octopus vulgaris TaxID=6645 RepID=A0AA36BGX6_OCTVU|nr:Hypothetical predicted protein [Octopus vulgaris]